MGLPQLGGQWCPVQPEEEDGAVLSLSAVFLLGAAMESRMLSPPELLSTYRPSPFQLGNPRTVHKPLGYFS